MASCYPHVSAELFTLQSQAYLDYYGVSETTAKAREFGGVLVNNSDMLDAQKWYSVVGGQSNLPQYYTYSATNLQLTRSVHRIHYS